MSSAKCGRENAGPSSSSSTLGCEATCLACSSPRQSRTLWNTEMSRRPGDDRPWIGDGKRKVDIESPEVTATQPDVKVRRRGSMKVQICTIRGCGKETTYPKLDLVEAHIPEVFTDMKKLSDDLTWTRHSCLIELAQYLVGFNAGLHHICDYFNEHQLPYTAFQK